MKENSDKNFNIAHLGLNFWKELHTKYPTFYFQESDAFLLCLDGDGHLLDYFPPSDRVSRTSVVVKACHKLEALPKGPKTLVRMQSQPAFQRDPFEMGSTYTETLYGTAARYGYHLVEVIIPLTRDS